MNRTSVARWACEDAVSQPASSSWIHWRLRGAVARFLLLTRLRLAHTFAVCVRWRPRDLSRSVSSVSRWPATWACRSLPCAFGSAPCASNLHRALVVGHAIQSDDRAAPLPPGLGYERLEQQARHGDVGAAHRHGEDAMVKSVPDVGESAPASVSHDSSSPSRGAAIIVYAAAENNKCAPPAGSQDAPERTSGHQRTVQGRYPSPRTASTSAPAATSA